MGLDRNIQESIQGYGTNTAFFSTYHRAPLRALKQGRAHPQPLGLSDYIAVRDSCNACVHVTVSLFNDERINTARFKGRGCRASRFAGATGESSPSTPDAIVAQGRACARAENLRHREVTMVGADLYHGPLPGMNPIGKPVSVGGSHSRCWEFSKNPRVASAAPQQQRSPRRHSLLDVPQVLSQRQE